ncbi:uncharacterized protein LOC101753925 isoform X3 [Setaria italica]|uniref:uncharacterized protein LOC101753925 isoform X3 n=1 Tax=Setaria italica TaxID=4555 RepID=UPI000BE5334D|nr:uncharacterized protein LOC101753925 isoform X3 [Setaria italica]
MDAVVCGTCGSGSSPHLIVNCAGCNASEHRYCMKVLTYVIPNEWYCAGCQEYANGCPNPSQGGQTELQKPWHGCDKMKERETANMHLSHNNVAHQINPRSSNKFGNAKVKFISSEEVALLNRGRPPYVRSRFAVCPSKGHPSSPPNTKHSPNLKCISPSRSDTQVQALKRCAAASHDQTKIEDRSYFAKCQRKIHPASPPSVKQPSSMKSISPSRSDMQFQTLKQCAAASRDPAKIEGRPDFAMRRSQVHPASPPHVTLSASVGSDTGSKSEAESLNQNRGVILSINPSMEYTRRPPPAICWMFKAQFPSKVSSKVYDIVKMIPSNLELELLPRMNDWPKSFEACRPVYEDIGLFFFPNEPDGRKKHSYLFEESNNYVLRARINGIKLLIYSSEVLPHDSQWIDGECYLWGVFVRLEGKSVPRQFGPTTT